jgi:broad specificity phosphatase PhoE
MRYLIGKCILLLIATLSHHSYSDSTASIDKNIIDGVKSGKYIVLMRHALAPGGGDPQNFDVNNCETQRNLSAEGRNQAKRIGELLKDNGVVNAAVYSSQWCRCMDTASLLNYGEVEALKELNSFFQEREREQEQTQGLKQWLVESINQGEAAIILVTHQVNITALTGIFPSSGEMVIIEPLASGEINVIARVPTSV